MFESIIKDNFEQTLY